jgi:hypothetical protein
MPEKPLPRVVIDTSIWLLTCARKTEGDNMSGVDRQINEASQSQSPKKYRGFLARMLVTHEVIVPTIVLNELKNIAATGITNRSEFGNLGKIVHKDNKVDPELIINAMEGLTTDALPTKAQIIRQAAIWERIKNMPDQSHRWVEKFQPKESRVQTAAEKAKAIQTNEEPWLQAYRRWQLRREEFEKNYTSELSRKIQALETEMQHSWPDIIPDYEILLVAEAVNAPVASRDKDFQLMWLGSVDLSRKFSIKPQIVTTVQDITLPKTSVHKLAATIQEKVRPFVQKSPEPGME